MMKHFTEMNELEKKGARNILRNDGWTFGSFTSSDGKAVSKPGWTNGLVSVYEDDIMIGQDAFDKP